MLRQLHINLRSTKLCSSTYF